jgi:hypothetical protein
MTRTKFVTKDNVHEATDVPRIRRLMANAERLGEHEIILKCDDRLSELVGRNGSKRNIKKTFHVQELNQNINKIELKFWLDKNPYYGKNSLLPKSIKTAKTKLQNHLSILYDFKFCGEVTDAIETKVRSYIDNPSSDAAVEIFDLIMLWGGAEGVKLTRNSFYRNVRHKVNEWLPAYLSFIDKVINSSTKLDDPKSALRHFASIKGVGMSFATKHLRWWGEYPIYDNRIGLLLYSVANISTINETSLNIYSNYLKDITKLSNQHNLTLLEVEKALFGFSQNFFPNSNLILVKSPKFTEQIDLAAEISREADL